MARSARTKPSASEPDKDIPSTNPVEWGIAAVSAVLLLALVAFLTYEAVTRDGTQPTLELSVEEIVEGPTAYTVVLEVFNAGDMTGAAVEIEGTLTIGQETSVSNVVLDYAPARSTRRAALLFEQDPRAGELELRVTGYTDP